MAGTMRKGNWFEEAALENYTGIKDFDPKKPEMGKFTYTRCIEHTDRLEAKNFESVMASCIKDPAKHEHTKTLKDRVGPRFAMLEAQYKDDIDSTMKTRTAEAYTKNREVEYKSENRRNFNRENFQPSLQETKDERRVKTHSANYCVEPAITFFSESVNSGEITFPLTFTVSNGNPFRKSSAFSVPIENGDVGSMTESNERPRPFPTAREFAGVKSLRDRLIRHTASSQNLKPGTGKIMSQIVNVLWGMISSTVPQVHIDELVSGLSVDLGFTVSDMERSGILRTFNDDNTGNISLPELTDFLRGTLSPRAGELVDIVLTRLAPNDDGSVIETDIRTLYKGSEDIAIIRAGAGVTVDDLYEYFTDCAAELETADRFENMISLWM
jgi:hypothetical protein